MTKMIFVNLPVTDLPRSRAFYEALGFTNNPQFSDDTAACMVWTETINVMLLTHAKWRSFTSRPIPPSGSSEVMFGGFLQQQERRRRHERCRGETWRNGRHQPEAGSRIHVQPEPRRSRWPRVGSDVDGSVGDALRRVMGQERGRRAIPRPRTPRRPQSMSRQFV